ncbi:hypothetical protein CDD83_9049 [Cordyceps sp. RAO-2017]|nr:hypothetical protein CDD83_9049 [Cordyceps sp. RAO-2017]
MRPATLLALGLGLVQARPPSLASAHPAVSSDKPPADDSGATLASRSPDWPCKRAAPKWKADIRADTNRDGRVSIKDDSDVDGKANWTETRGALFLANIADSNRRCLNLLGKDLDKLMHCNDSSDNVQRAPERMARIRTVPMHGLGASAFGRITVSNDTARRFVRIFRPGSSGSDWNIVEGDSASFSPKELKEGLMLGIDARDTRKHGVWDGKVTVTLTVEDGGKRSTDSVMLRVAPVLTHHHLQPIEAVYVPSHDDSTMRGISEQIRNLLKLAKIPAAVKEVSTRHTWIQDLFESAYMSIPGPNHTDITLRVMVEAELQRVGSDREAETLTFVDFRKEGFAAVQYWDDGKPGRSFGHMGNFETIPPYEHKGRKYPAGRLVIGGPRGDEAGDRHEPPLGFHYFQAQETQDPILLHSTWLSVGHVDEFIHFLPAETPRRWSVMVSDPRAGMQLLKDIQDRGLVPYRTIWPTVGSLLASEEFRRDNKIASKAIDANIATLKEETGITDGEIFRVPALYSRSLPHASREPKMMADVPQANSRHEQRSHPSNRLHDHGTVERRGGTITVTAYLPGAINGLVVGKSQYLSPKPWGPVIGDTDVFEKAIKEAFAKAKFNVTFVDDWTVHEAHGEIHCATNTLREMKKNWWTM